MNTDNLTDSEITLLKKGLWIQKEDLLRRLSEIDKLINELDSPIVDSNGNETQEGDSHTIDEGLKFLKFSYVDSRENFYKGDTFKSKVDVVLTESIENLSSRETLEKIYFRFKNVKKEEDRKNIQVTSNLLNLGVKSGRYYKEKRGNTFYYGRKK